MKIYAGIGSRSLSSLDDKFCQDIGFWLAERGWKLHTGAAKGADQAFANGALEAGGEVHLCLPWPSYEFPWVEVARGLGATTSVLNPAFDVNAMDSVDLYHPNPNRLSDTVRKLHARNYLILEHCKFVLAFPKTDHRGNLGGTGQGIRIAKDCGIEILRLDEPQDRKRVETKLSA